MQNFIVISQICNINHKQFETSQLLNLTYIVLKIIASALYLNF